MELGKVVGVSGYSVSTGLLWDAVHIKIYTILWYSIPDVMTPDVDKTVEELIWDLVDNSLGEILVNEIR